MTSLREAEDLLARAVSGRSADSDHAANTGMECGAPSGRTVASQNQPPFLNRSCASSQRMGCELPVSPSASVPFPSRDIAPPAGPSYVIRISPPRFLP